MRQAEICRRLRNKIIRSAKNMKVLNMELGEHSYPIIVGRGLLTKANEYFNLDRKVYIVTDDGVPANYADTIKFLCKSAEIKTVKAGEGSKSLSILEDVLTGMSDFGLSRSDCVVAVGGGVVGDLAGFAAAVYMRGIDFYNIPTTLLSQVDSSIGGKTAVNLGKVKNSVGAFKQPRAVLVDADTLSTLSTRHFNNGLCEAIKMAATSDRELFTKLELLNPDTIYNNIEEIITSALQIKKSVVEIDECEKGLRKILNFGHTFGHAIESAEGLSGLYHGECVALGMLAVSTGEVKERIKRVLARYDLPTEYDGDINYAFSFLSHDKKCNNNGVSAILCPAIGEHSIKNMTLEEFKELVTNNAW